MVEATNTYKLKSNQRSSRANSIRSKEIIMIN